MFRLTLRGTQTAEKQPAGKRVRPLDDKNDINQLRLFYG